MNKYSLVSVTELWRHCCRRDLHDTRTLSSISKNIYSPVE